MLSYSYFILMYFAGKQFWKHKLGCALWGKMSINLLVCCFCDDFVLMPLWCFLRYFDYILICFGRDLDVEWCYFDDILILCVMLFLCYFDILWCHVDDTLLLFWYRFTLFWFICDAVLVFFMSFYVLLVFNIVVNSSIFLIDLQSLALKLPMPSNLDL